MKKQFFKGHPYRTCRIHDYVSYLGAKLHAS